MKYDELLEALPLEVMRNLEPKKRMEIIRSIDTVKLYQAEEAYENSKEAVEEAKRALDFAEAELENARRRVKEAEDRLAQKTIDFESIERAYNEKRESLEKEKKRKVAIVHSSASLKQLEENIYATFFIPVSEKDILDVLNPSKIFECPENFKWVKIIPESLKNLEEGSRKNGILAFCELAMEIIDFKKSQNLDTEVKLLYKDEIIRKVFEANGLPQ